MSSSSLQLGAQKRRMTAMEIKKQQKQRKSIGISLNNNGNSQEALDDGVEKIQEIITMKEEQRDQVENKEKNDPYEDDPFKQHFQNNSSGENSSSTNLFNSQFNNFYSSFCQKQISELSKKGSGSQPNNGFGLSQTQSSSYKRDSKQQILQDLNNYQIVTEVSLISAVPFDWFYDIFSCQHQLSHYNVSQISKNTLINFKNVIKNSISTYRYERRSVIQYEFNSSGSKEKIVTRNQEIFLTMRDVFAQFLIHKANYFYYTTPIFTALFLHQQNLLNSSDKEKDKVVALIWARPMKTLPKFFEKSGIEFIDLSQLQKDQIESELLDDQKNQEEFEEENNLQNHQHKQGQGTATNKKQEGKNQKYDTLFATQIDSQSNLFFVQKKFVQSLWNALINANFESEKEHFQQPQKVEIMSNFPFEQSYKTNLKEYFNGQIIASDSQSYAYLFDELNKNDFSIKPQPSTLDFINFEDKKGTLYNIKLKGEIPFLQLKALVSSLQECKINFAVFYELNFTSKYFVQDILKFQS